MAEKEKKLQEFFCKKLDRKINKISEENKANVDQLIRSHEHQIVLFEQEFKASQARITDLEAQLKLALSQNHQ